MNDDWRRSVEARRRDTSLCALCGVAIGPGCTLCRECRLARTLASKRRWAAEQKAAAERGRAAWRQKNR